KLKQKIETWNLRSDKWDLYRQILGKKLEEWRNNTLWWDQNNRQLLDFAVESWTNYVVESAKQSIGAREREKTENNNAIKENIETRETRIFESLKEENTRKLFSQFKSMNSNKVSIIQQLDRLQRQIKKKQNCWYREDKITSVIEMNREMNYPLWNEYHQMGITEEEIIEALRYISQGPHLSTPVMKKKWTIGFNANKFR
ncbi:hypothetical protein RFI_36999, partial [Reticulomyxa filosa]